MCGGCKCRFVKTLAIFEIIYTTDPLLQNITKIVCLRALLRVPIFRYKSSFHALKRSRWSPLFLLFWHKQLNLSDCSKKNWKNLSTETFSRERPLSEWNCSAIAKSRKIQTTVEFCFQASNLKEIKANWKLFFYKWKLISIVMHFWKSWRLKLLCNPW